MQEYLLNHVTTVRLSAFLGVFALVALGEQLAPRRQRSASLAVRWFSNLGVLVVSSALLRVIAPLTAIALAALAQQRGWGLLNAFVVPGWVGLLLSVAALDLVIYLQHVMFHAVPALWRLHRMHHADLDLDVTSGGRFHPFEIALSMGLKLAAVVVLGAPPLAVLIFETVLNVTAMFNHGNMRLPLALDRVLRLFVVTPDMHRVHHSVLAAETNSNFGFNLPWWDRLLGTYTAQPSAGHQGMTIGLNQFREPRELWLHRMLWQPFRSAPDGQSIGGRVKSTESGAPPPEA